MNVINRLKRKAKNQKKATLIKTKENESDFDKVFPKMTPKEQEQNFINSISGMWDRSNNVVYMGAEAIDRCINFQKQMIKKYSK